MFYIITLVIVLSLGFVLGTVWAALHDDKEE